MDDPKEFASKLMRFRFDDRFHLGLGDVRLPRGDGDEVIAALKELAALRAENERLRALVQEFADAASHLCLVMAAHKVDSINRDLQKAADRLADLAWKGDR